MVRVRGGAGGDMDDKGTGKGKESGDVRGWDVGTSRRKVGGHTVMPIGARCKRPCHVKRKRRGKSETREILASSFVKGGYRKLL